MAAQTPILVPMGGYFMSVLAEGATPTERATRSQLSAWITRARAPFSMVLDGVAPQPGIEAYFRRSRDTYILVDLRTMTITDIIATDVARALNRMRTLLQ